MDATKKQDTEDSNISNLLKLGIEHSEAGRYTEAIKCFEIASNQGSAKGMYDLAICYLRGKV